MRKSSIIISITIVLVLLVFSGYFLGPKFFSKVKLAVDPLPDPEILNLVSFLKQNNLQAAMIQKIDDTNTKSIWLVKATGQKINLSREDLGYDGWGQPNYRHQGRCEVSAFMLPDNTAAITFSKFSSKPGALYEGKRLDISAYVTGYTKNALWSDDTFINNFKSLSRLGYYFENLAGISPDGKHALSLKENFGETILNTVQNSNGQLVLQPVGTLPPFDFLAWSTDGKNILMNKRVNPKQGIEIYNIEKSTTSHVDVNLSEKTGGNISDSGNLQWYIYPSTLIYCRMNSVNALNFENDNEKNILPNGILLIGLIP